MCSWNYPNPFPVRQTEHPKISPVQREDRLDPFAVCQVHQRCIGQLYPQAGVLGQNRGNGRKIRLVQRQKLKGPATERCQESPDGLGICTQEPCRLGNHGPARQQRTSDAPKLLDACIVVFIGLQQDCYDRAGIDKQPGGQEPPNPSKYFGFVLRSRTFPFAAPINPALFACS